MFDSVCADVGGEPGGEHEAQDGDEPSEVRPGIDQVPAPTDIQGGQSTFDTS